MSKRSLLLATLAFLSLPKLAFADLVISVVDPVIPSLVVVTFIEVLAFRVLAMKLLYRERGNQLQGVDIGFGRALIGISVANIVTSLLLLPLRAIAGLESLYYEIYFSSVLFVVSLSIAYIVSVFVEWGIYIPFFRKFTARISRLLIISLIVNVTTYLLLGFSMSFAAWDRRLTEYKMSSSQRHQILAAIRVCEESYFVENGVYVECKPSPPDGGSDRKPDWWVDAGGFEEIGFAPDGRVRHQYAVRLSEDGQSYVVIAKGDTDEDGRTSAYVIDKSSPSYPKVEKDTAGIYSDGDDY